MNHIETRLLKLVMLCLSTLLSACAGPATPFGSLNFWSAQNKYVENTTNEDIQVSFLPGTQRFHKLNNFKILVKDRRGVPETAKVFVYHNGREVSDAFETSIDLDTETLTANFKNLRLNPRKLHEVAIHYQAHEKDAGITSAWTMPGCDTQSMEPIQHTRPFKVSPKLLTQLETAALDNEINPALLAGLVAQESGFNNKAVSWAKAIGMTQITHIAEEEIKDKVKAWPRYPGIRKYSYAKLKWKVLKGEITPKNEWRLNPEKSFKGGSLYLKHLLKYWGYPSKRKLVAENNLNLDEVILASYNIGPTAVSRAIQRKGKDWLKDREGKSALKYVHMVGSYCSDFSRELAYAK